MTEILTEAIELRFHRAMRRATPVGTLKNGAGAYRLTTCNGETVYLARRKARKETAKGYTQAAELNLKQMETATFTDRAAAQQAIRAFRKTVENCHSRIQGCHSCIKGDAKWLAEYMAAGEEGVTSGGESSGLVNRITSVPERGQGETKIKVPTQSLWTEKYRTFTNKQGRQPNLWLPEGWQNRGTHTVHFEGAFDSEIEGYNKEIAHWTKVADAHEAALP